MNAKDIQALYNMIVEEARHIARVTEGSPYAVDTAIQRVYEAFDSAEITDAIATLDLDNIVL